MASHFTPPDFPSDLHYPVLVTSRPHERLPKTFLNLPEIVGVRFIRTPTLHNCDSCYHIFVTNVKAKTRNHSDPSPDGPFE